MPPRPRRSGAPYGTPPDDSSGPCGYFSAQILKHRKRGDYDMPDIDIAAPDGGSFSAYLATPASGSGPGVVVIQEIFGVNRVMRDICDGLAADGYIACSPDLFWRQEPASSSPTRPRRNGRRLRLPPGFRLRKGGGRHRRHHRPCSRPRRLHRQGGHGRLLHGRQPRLHVGLLHRFRRLGGLLPGADRGQHGQGGRRLEAAMSTSPRGRVLPSEAQRRSRSLADNPLSPSTSIRA